MARTKKKSEHYVNNKEFLAAMVEYKKLVNKAKREGKKDPRVPDYIGECFLKIANHLSYRPNFINYTYRDDMISDGIENCLQYLNNFNPDTSNNPFAYFTQIIYYAFLRRIQKEKKQQHIKNQMIEKQQYELYDVNEGDDTVYDIGGFDPEIMLPEEDVYKPKKKSPTDSPEGLEQYMEEKLDEDSTDN
jgi:DNA-directed RNA polymerase specialized sigma subunit